MLLSFKDLAAITDRTEVALRRQMDSDHVALMFGARRGGRLASYLPADAVALQITEELARHFGRRDAATAARVACDVWAEAVARADHGEEIMLVAVEYGPKGHGDLGVAFATKEDLPKMVAALDPATNVVVFVNLNKLLDDVRSRAAALGIDLSARFLPPPGTPELTTLLRRGRSYRLGLIREMQRAAAEKAAAERPGRAVDN